MMDNKLFFSHIEDLIASVKKGRKYAFSSFLNIEQLSEVVLYLKHCDIYSKMYGGYDESERNMIGFSADCEIDHNVFPITTLFFPFSAKTSISHRDVLGALMSLGIKRELIGDILFADKICYFFVDSKIAPFICMNLFSVASIRVDVLIYCGDIEYSPQFEEYICIVSSLRLDCVVSEFINKSRTYTTELIEKGMVFINGIQCLKKDKNILVGDTLSIRHIGKFRVVSDEGNTKKNRTKLKIFKYI